MLNKITAMADKMKNEKTLKRRENVISAVIEAGQDKLGGMLRTDDAMLLVNEIFTLREMNEILTDGNIAFKEMIEEKDQEIQKLNDKLNGFIEQLKISLDGVDMYAKRAAAAERTIRLEERKRVNCPKDIMQVYGYRE